MHAGRNGGTTGAISPLDDASRGAKPPYPAHTQIHSTQILLSPDFCDLSTTQKLNLSIVNTAIQGYGQFGAIIC